jgi:hypothetical protein
VAVVSHLEAVKCDVCGVLKPKMEERAGWITFAPRTIIHVSPLKEGVRSPNLEHACSTRCLLKAIGGES